MMEKNSQGLSAELEKVLESDDNIAFLELVQSLQCHEVTNSLVNHCVDFGAIECLISLVRGSLVRGCTSLVYPTLDTQIPDGGVTALAYVAHTFPDPRILDVMLSKCGAIGLVNVSSTIGLVHGLPIHFVLIQLSLVNHLYNWSRGQSIINLIILLCYWETKPLLDCARLLSVHTNSINDIAWILLKNGGLKQFTALLLIAREKVVAQFDTGLTIHQYISREIDSIDEDKLNIEQEEYKCMLMDAKKLLDVFEATGDDLSSYCNSMREHVSVDQVSDDIFGLLIKNRISVTSYDFDFSGCIKKFQGLSSSNMEILSTINGTNWLNASPAKSSAYDGSYALWKPRRSTAVPIPNIASQQRLYSTRSCQMIKKPLLHAITVKFIKGFKFL